MPRYGEDTIMKVGDLVKFVGHAKFYKDRIGTIVKTWGHSANQSAYIYFPVLRARVETRMVWAK